MPTLTVDQTQTPVTSGHKNAAFGVQRFLRSMTSGAAKTNAINFIAPFTDVIIYHWSGGYANSSSGAQLWGATDFAPGTMNSARIYTDLGSKQGLDHAVANLDAIVAINPNAKIVFVMHDIPQAMNNGFTRTSNGTLTPWPAPSFWGSAFGAKLAQDLLNHFGTKVLALAYGQEGKGVKGHFSDVTARKAFTQGAVNLFTILKASHPWCERWYPHLNFFSTQSNMQARANAVDAMIAGGNLLETNDRPIFAGLLADMPVNLVDRITIDWSILDNNTSDIWAGASGNSGTYDAVKIRTSLGYHLVRVCRLYMQAAWGTTVPIVSIERYWDVNQHRQQWASPAQQAALTLSMVMWLMKAPGHTVDANWEPQADDPVSGVANASGGEIMSWFKKDGTPTLTGQAIAAAQAAIPVNSPLFPVTSDDPDIEGVASATTAKIIVLNKNKTTAKAVTINATSGTINAGTIPALGWVVLSLASGGHGASRWGWNTAAAGVMSQATISGSAGSRWGFASAAAGRAANAGAAVSAWGWSTAAAGQPGTAGIADSAFGWTPTGTGLQALAGYSASAWSFSTAGVGLLTLTPVTGTSATAWGWATGGTGLHTDPFVGDGTTEWNWSTAGVGVESAAVGPHGDAASAFGWSTAAAGENFTISATSASAFGWSSAGVGVSSSLLGIAASAFDWGTSAIGQATLIQGYAASAWGWSVRGQQRPGNNNDNIDWRDEWFWWRRRWPRRPEL